MKILSKAKNIIVFINKNYNQFNCLLGLIIAGFKLIIDVE